MLKEKVGFEAAFKRRVAQYQGALREMLEEKVGFETAFERRKGCTVLDRPIIKAIHSKHRYRTREPAHTKMLLHNAVPVRSE